MKIFVTVLVSAIVFFTLQNIIPTQDEFEIYDATVRLHVLANSDSEQDQALKLKVRDELLNTVKEYSVNSKEEAIEKIEENKEYLIKIAEDVVKKEGKAYPVDIEIGKEYYQTRYYEDFALPAGEYTSVRVIIGEGEGQNWWCVMYPPLCTGAAIGYDDEAYLEVGLTKGQYNLITENQSGECKIKFKLLEIAAEAFGIEY